jgi:hypothetical protein
VYGVGGAVMIIKFRIVSSRWMGLRSRLTRDSREIREGEAELAVAGRYAGKGTAGRLHEDEQREGVTRRTDSCIGSTESTKEMRGIA